MKYFKYLLLMFFVFIGTYINVYADDFLVKINASQDVLDQYSDYTIILSTHDKYQNSSGICYDTCTFSYDDQSGSIIFDSNGVGHLDVHLSNPSTTITISGLRFAAKLKTEFDETKESTRMTGQSADVDDDLILGGYFLSNSYMQIWNIQSKNQTTNINFKKYFEDEGFESYRPESSTFYLYNKNDLNTVVATTSINYGNNSIYEFDGEFINVPKFDSNGKEIEYTIIEEKIPYYANSTDSKYGLKIKFNNKNKLGYPGILKMFYKENETDKLHMYEYTSSGMGDELNGKTIEVIHNAGFFTNNSHFSTVNDLLEFASFYADFPSIEELVADQYPETRHPYPLGETHAWHYSSSISGHSQDFYMAMRTESWGGHFGLLIDNISNIGNDTILTSTINLRDLEVTKKWEDIGSDSVTFNIYDVNDMNTIIKSVTLNKNEHAIDDYTWKLTIKNLPKYDANNHEIEYTIVEENVDNYFTLYDYPEEFDGLKIKFSADTFIEAEVCYSTNANFEGEMCLFYPGNGYVQSLATQIGYGVGPLTNQTLYIPTKYFKLYFRVANTPYLGTSALHKVKIEDISLYKSSTPSSSHSKSIGSSAEYYGRHSFTDYINFYRLNKSDYSSSDGLWEYEWKGSPTSLGNTTIVRNLINIKDIEFTKKWNDKGFETYRPDNVVFQLFNENDLNTVVKEVTLTSADAVAGDQYTWSGVFEGVPKYNNDGSEIKYVIKEKPVDNYVTTYSLDDIKGFFVTFNGISYANKSAKIATIRSSINMHYALYYRYAGEYSDFFKDLTNKTIYIPAGEFNRFIIDYSNQNATYSNNYGFKITSIVPVNYDYGSYQPYSGVGFYYLDEYNYFSGDNYPESTHPNDDAQIYVYSYEPLSTPFAGANIIINEIGLKKVEVTKKWVDRGNEEYRPDSIQINIYNANDMSTPVITDTLSKNDKKDDYTWYKAYNLPKYDSNKKEIDYIVVETPIDNYTTSYTSNDEYNGLEIKFYKNSTTTNNSFMIYYPLNDNTLAIVAKTNNYFVHTSGANIKADSATIRIPSTEFYLIQNNSDIKIEYIKPVIMDTNEFLYGETSISSLSGYDIVEVTGNEYINIDNSNPVWHYTLGKFNNSFINANIITNETEFTTYDFYKVWDDDGYSYARPNRIKFSLYNSLDDSLVKEIYLTENDIDVLNPLVWKGVFDGIPKNNLDGTVASYYVKEETLDSYTTTYESLNSNSILNVIKNTVKLMNVTFNKVDENGNKVVGAKILITTLDGTHVADFITDGNEKVLTLPVGEYLIVEEYAPDGYEVADDIKLKITADGKVYTDGNVTDIVKIVDKKIEEKEIIPEEDNPKTLDNLTEYLFIFVFSIISLMITIIIITRNKKRNA